MKKVFLLSHVDEQKCIGDKICENVCPTGAIKVFNKKANVDEKKCAACLKCLDVCEPKALTDTNANDSPWLLKASILPACLSLNAVVCRSCGEACEERSISFKLEPGGIARPQLDIETCTGCGECFAVCPVKSVEISPVKPRSQAA